MARHPIVTEDCARALEQTRALWAAVAGRRLFVTGGTGFFGSWLLELLTYAADTLSFDCEVVVLTRDPAAFGRGLASHLARHRCVHLLAGDVRTFTFPAGTFDHVVHFGSAATKKFHDEFPEEFFDLVVTGTRRVLDFAVQARAGRFLLASTGAVYGPLNLPPGCGVPETHAGAPDPLNPRSANGEAKRAAEFFALCAGRRCPAMAVSIARGFAFLGPYLPKDAGFAAYDFMQDAMAGRPIVVHGDGSPVRSYLYAGDLAVWLWTLLLRAPAGSAWNVGADRAVSIRELAHAIADSAPIPVAVDIKGLARPGATASSYLPDTTKARIELGLTATIPFHDAIRRTLQWTTDVSNRVSAVQHDSGPDHFPIKSDAPSSHHPQSIL